MVETGHAKQKMCKQHRLKIWISASGFEMPFLSVKIENIDYYLDYYIFIATFVEVVSI